MAPDLRELLERARLRIQRRWPTMMLVEKPLTIKDSSGAPGEPHKVLEEVVAVAALDIDAGVQLVAIVAERFGDVGEHRSIVAAEEELLKLGSGLLIKSGSAIDPHGQQTSSADENSLRPGDSLVESIENGLGEGD